MGRYTNKIDGFTLPTVLLASVLMLAVLATALQLVSATSASLRDQYYNQLAREAAEAGVLHAQECLSANGYEADWTAAKQLKPNTDCSGNIITSRPEYIINNNSVRSSYTVGVPYSVSGLQKIGVTASVLRMQLGTANISKIYTASGVISMGAKTSFDTVTFGYNPDGAFFGVIDASRRALATGYNGEGQLGDGTTVSRSTPAVYRLPFGVTAEQMFTSFLSIGRYMFVAGSDGNLYASGRNTDGELGIGWTSAYEATPRKVLGIPNGVKIKSVSMVLGTTFFVGDNFRVYAAGSCADGVLGDGRSLSGCPGASSAIQVGMFSGSSPELRPVLQSDWVQSTNISSDRRSVYVRTEGGRVYGWGINDFGQLARGNKTSATSPVRLGNFGDSGQPKVSQVAFDGDTIYLVTDNGKLYTAGRADMGQLLGAPSRIKYKANPSLCLTHMGLGVNYSLQSCSDANNNQLFTLRPDKRLEVSGYCVERYTGGTNDGDDMKPGSCTSSYIDRQDWALNDTGRFFNTNTNKCLDAAIASSVRLWGCYSNRGATQEWIIDDATTVREVPLPAGTKVVRLSTDQRSALVLLDNGEVWGGGANHSGQLGVGNISASRVVTRLTKMVLPSGRKATDIYTTMVGSHESTSPYANSFVILDNGAVFGAGSNHFGNLGIGSITSSYFPTPQPMMLPTNVKAKSVQAGLGSTVVLTTDGYIYTVGNNQNGQLGDGTTLNSGSPAVRKYVNVLPALVF